MERFVQCPFQSGHIREERIRGKFFTLGEVSGKLRSILRKNGAVRRVIVCIVECERVEERIADQGLDRREIRLQRTDMRMLHIVAVDRGVVGEAAGDARCGVSFRNQEATETGLQITQRGHCRLPLR